MDYHNCTLEWSDFLSVNYFFCVFGKKLIISYCFGDSRRKELGKICNSQCETILTQVVSGEYIMDFFFISLWLCNSCEIDCAQKQLVWSASPVKLTTQSNLNSNLFQGIWFHHLLCSHGSHAIYFHKILIHFLLVLLVLAFMIDLTFLFISCFIIIFLISIEFTFWTSFMKKY